MDKPDKVYIVIGWWLDLTPRLQFWREGVFDTPEEAETAFEAYVESNYKETTRPKLMYVVQLSTGADPNVTH